MQNVRGCAWSCEGRRGQIESGRPAQASHAGPQADRHGYGKEGVLRAVGHPLPTDQAAADVQAVDDPLRHASGRRPQSCAVMAHRPGGLTTLLPLSTALLNEGTVAPTDKELAWRTTSQGNGCVS
jgi:hypothetical protein